MYLAISGNIGSGKSTLTRMLADRYGLRPVYEPYTDNPYLEDFYHDMRRYSFHSQVYFLSRRLEQHLHLITGAQYVIQDRTVFEDAVSPNDRSMLARTFIDLTRSMSERSVS